MGTVDLENSQMLPTLVGSHFDVPTKPDRIFTVENPLHPHENLFSAPWTANCLNLLSLSLQSARKEMVCLSWQNRLKITVTLLQKILNARSDVLPVMQRELGRSAHSVLHEWSLLEHFATHWDEVGPTLLAPTNHINGEVQWVSGGPVLLSPNVSWPLLSLVSGVVCAIGAGNSVCLKPALGCSLSSHIVTQLIYQDLPTGVLQLVYGDFDVLRRLVHSQIFATAFVCAGEEAIGLLQRENSGNKCHLVLETAGKNAAIIMPSAPLETAVEKVVLGTTLDSGQLVGATGLCFVHESIWDTALARLEHSLKGVPVGARHSLGDAAHVMGPMCTAHARERFLRFQSIAAREAKETVRWGKSIDTPSGSLFVSPGLHVFSIDQVAASVVTRNPIFGPSLSVIPFSHLDHVHACTNSLFFTHSLSIHTQEDSEVHSVRQHSDVPHLIHNGSTTEPFPGLFPPHRKGLKMGLNFFYEVAVPKILTYASALAWGLLVLSHHPQKAYGQYQKAVEGNEVVKGKLYPRQGRWHVGLAGGAILNPSFVDTMLFGGSVGYHLNDWHAVHFEGLIGRSTDRSERTCVESFFFNDKMAQEKGGAETVCDPEGKYKPDPTKNPPVDDNTDDYFRKKPAYMPIRQIDMIFTANYQYTPVYGKALWFLSSVGYLDFFLNAGLGFAKSSVWALKETNAKGELVTEKGVTDNEETGLTGRPPMESTLSPVVQLGIGNRFYFAKNFTVEMHFRNISIFALGGKGQTELLNLAMWGGVAMML